MMTQLSSVYFIYIEVLLSGNHKLTATAKVIVKICEHEVGAVCGYSLKSLTLEQN